MDDVILFDNSLHTFPAIKTQLHTTFGIKDLGILKYFLGLEVAHSSAGITLSQRRYCLDLLQDSSLLDCKPTTTPLDHAIRLHQDNGQSFSDVSSYRRLVGRLLYLTSTRLDIAFATQQVGQFMSSPTLSHHKAAVRILRYLKRSPGLGLFFPRSTTRLLRC